MSMDTTFQETAETPLPGSRLSASKMPGHWLLARLGKRVLRPGGIEATRKMLSALGVGNSDDVVEFAPGLGITARMTLQHTPHSYTAIERDEEAATRVRHYLQGDTQRCLVATAQNTGLPDQSASTVYGEAMLTMQGDEQKLQIIKEAYRLLRSGGCYGIHELAITPDNISPSIRDEIYHELIDSIHVNARPLTPKEWADQLQESGFKIKAQYTVPMRLLEPVRLIQDEGFTRFLKILSNMLRDGDARKRVLHMRSVFRKYSNHLAAVIFVGQK